MRKCFSYYLGKTILFADVITVQNLCRNCAEALAALSIGILDRLLQAITQSMNRFNEILWSA
jgi:hypothetical protein